jgi:nitrate/nitrite-specific signal transduction histidine kinase
MGALLQKSYGELEERVIERTIELEKLASENERHYEEAKVGVQTRDEFMSIASHELKIPINDFKRA